MINIKIGWGEVSLVPEGRKVNLSGQFYEKITDVVETPISVTALAIECGEDSVIFCSCDLVHAGEKFLAEARRKLVDTDVPLDKIILSVIHSHTSLDFVTDRESFFSLPFLPFYLFFYYKSTDELELDDLTFISGYLRHDFLEDSSDLSNERKELFCIYGLKHFQTYVVVQIYPNGKCIFF